MTIEDDTPRRKAPKEEKTDPPRRPFGVTLRNSIHKLLNGGKNSPEYMEPLLFSDARNVRIEAIQDMSFTPSKKQIDRILSIDEMDASVVYGLITRFDVKFTQDDVSQMVELYVKHHHVLTSCAMIEGLSQSIPENNSRNGFTIIPTQNATESMEKFIRGRDDINFGEHSDKILATHQFDFPYILEAMINNPKTTIPKDKIDAMTSSPT